MEMYGKKLLIRETHQLLMVQTKTESCLLTDLKSVKPFTPRVRQMTWGEAVQTLLEHD